MGAHRLATVPRMGETDTQGESIIEASSSGSPVPGLLVVFSGNTPMYRQLPLVPGVNHVVGRDDLGGITVPDERVSRQHAELCWSPGPDGVLTVRDLDSRNGVFVNGQRVVGTARAGVGAVVRLAQTILVVFEDLRRFDGGDIEMSEGVVGPTLRQALDLAAVAARTSAHLIGHGETGTGKERLARAFHAAVGPRTPFVAVNCLAVPATLAASLFFGAVRGAATDVRQSEGYLGAANGGVLFLDEIAELPLEIQGMLLRAVESGEVTPVGSHTPARINVRIVTASAIDLRQAVASGRFRSDLYYRLAQAEVEVPALRERKEDLPWLMQYALSGQPVSLHASAVESAMLRHWPGNVRELLAATRQAITAALAEIPRDGLRLRDRHLNPVAGARLGGGRGGDGGSGGGAAGGVSVQEVVDALNEEEAKEGWVPPLPAPAPARPSRERVREALDACDWNISATCRMLNIPHRTQLYRLMKDYGSPLERETS